MPPRCPTCGAEVPEDAEICPECGMELSKQLTPIPPAPSEVEAGPPPEVEAGPPPEVEAGPPPEVEVGARLLLKRGGIPTGQEFPIGGKSIIVGRFDVDKGPVDVDLSDIPEGMYVSRHHAELYKDPSGQWFVRDLNSSNGTFIWRGGSGQPERIPPDQPTPINDGDEIAFGNARFLFRIG